MSFSTANADGTRPSAIGFSFITPIPSKPTGVSSYADSLIAAFAARRDGEAVRLITNADLGIFERITRAANIEIVTIGPRGKTPYKLWSIYAHFKAALMAKSSKIKCLVSVTPQGSFIRVIDQLIVIHDSYDIEPQFSAASHVLYSRFVRKLSIAAAKGVICVSETTRRDACALLNMKPSKFVVIKEASKYQPVDGDQIQPDTDLTPRFLFVANVEHTKNPICLLEALRLAEKDGLPLQVDWIGRDTGGIIAQWLQRNGPLSNFSSHGYVDDEVLRKAYRSSAALVVPSLREGFCLPVLEAHSVGTPAICSDIPVLREVAGAGGIFFKPTDPTDLLRVLKAVASDQELRRALARGAAANARLYSWDRSADELERFATKSCGIDISVGALPR